MKIIEYFRSPYEITIEKNAAHAVLDFLVRFDIPFHHLEDLGETVSFRLFAPYFREYVSRRRERRFAGEIRKRLGFAVFCARYQKRAGLFFGGALAAFLMIFSSLFVWDITVSGNETIPESVILKALEENGLHLGAFIPTLDTEHIEGIVSLSVDGISFFSINLRGTVAETEIRERETNTEIIDTESPSNLIAKTDGQISAMEVTGGVTKVKLGQIVKKGDLLASGIIDSNALGYRLVRARGEVFARTTMTFSAEVPLIMTEDRHTGKTKTVNAVKFFSKTLKLFGKHSFSHGNYGTIEEERRLYLFGKIKLPIFLIQTTYAEYELVTRTLSEEEALQKAKEDIRRQCDEILSDAEILAWHTDFACDGQTLFLTQKADCILDIAEEVKIGTHDTEK